MAPYIALAWHFYESSPHHRGTDCYFKRSPSRPALSTTSCCRGRAENDGLWDLGYLFRESFGLLIYSDCVVIKKAEAAAVPSLRRMWEIRPLGGKERVHKERQESKRILGRVFSFDFTWATMWAEQTWTHLSLSFASFVQCICFPPLKSAVNRKKWYFISSGWFEQNSRFRRPFQLKDDFFCFS